MGRFGFKRKPGSWVGGHQISQGGQNHKAVIMQGQERNIEDLRVLTGQVLASIDDLEQVVSGKQKNTLAQAKVTLTKQAGVKEPLPGTKKAAKAVKNIAVSAAASVIAVPAVEAIDKLLDAI